MYTPLHEGQAGGGAAHLGLWRENVLLGVPQQQPHALLGLQVAFLEGHADGEQALQHLDLTPQLGLLLGGARLHPGALAGYLQCGVGFTLAPR